jgi:hypothetical protein
MVLMLMRIDTTFLDPAADVVAYALDDRFPGRIDDLVAARLGAPDNERRQRDDRGLARRMSHDLLQFLASLP